MSVVSIFMMEVNAHLSHIDAVFGTLLIYNIEIGGGAGCQVTWKTPDSDEYVAIPPTAWNDAVSSRVASYCIVSYEYCDVCMQPLLAPVGVWIQFADTYISPFPFFFILLFFSSAPSE